MRKIGNLKCPECGKELKNEDKEALFCKFCGSKLISNNEYTFKNINAAEIKRAETEQLVKLKQLELKEKEEEHKKEVLRLKIKASIILAIIGMFLMIIGDAFGSASGDSDSGWYMISVTGLFPLMAAGFIWLFNVNNNSPEEENEKEEDDL